MLSYRFVIELIDKPKFQATYKESSKVVHKLISNLASKLVALPPDKLYSELAPLSVSQLASLICVLSTGARGYTAHPAINPVVSSLIEQLARRVLEGPFGLTATSLAGTLLTQLNPNVGERLSPDEINQVAYNLAALLSYYSIYQPTTLVTPQVAPKTTTQSSTSQAALQLPTSQLGDQLASSSTSQSSPTLSDSKSSEPVTTTTTTTTTIQPSASVTTIPPSPHSDNNLPPTSPISEFNIVTGTTSWRQLLPFHPDEDDENDKDLNLLFGVDSLVTGRAVRARFPKSVCDILHRRRAEKENDEDSALFSEPYKDDVRITIGPFIEKESRERPINLSGIPQTIIEKVSLADVIQPEVYPFVIAAGPNESSLVPYTPWMRLDYRKYGRFFLEDAEWDLIKRHKKRFRRRYFAPCQRYCVVPSTLSARYLGYLDVNYKRLPLFIDKISENLDSDTAMEEAYGMFNTSNKMRNAVEYRGYRHILEREFTELSAFSHPKKRKGPKSTKGIANTKGGTSVKDAEDVNKYVNKYANKYANKDAKYTNKYANKYTNKYANKYTNKDAKYAKGVNALDIIRSFTGTKTQNSLHNFNKGIKNYQSYTKDLSHTVRNGVKSGGRIGGSSMFFDQLHKDSIHRVYRVTPNVSAMFSNN
jgi:hypothetical protein